MKITKTLRNLYSFYQDGFAEMTVGRTLWILVIIKLFVIFVILKIFFFPDFLKSNFKDDESRARHVRQELISK